MTNTFPSFVIGCIEVLLFLIEFLLVSAMYILFAQKMNTFFMSAVSSSTRKEDMSAVGHEKGAERVVNVALGSNTFLNEYHRFIWNICEVFVIGLWLSWRYSIFFHLHTPIGFLHKVGFSTPNLPCQRGSWRLRVSWTTMLVCLLHTFGFVCYIHVQVQHSMSSSSTTFQYYSLHNFQANTNSVDDERNATIYTKRSDSSQQHHAINTNVDAGIPGVLGSVNTAPTAPTAPTDLGGCGRPTSESAESTATTDGRSNSNAGGNLAWLSLTGERYCNQLLSPVMPLFEETAAIMLHSAQQQQQQQQQQNEPAQTSSLLLGKIDEQGNVYYFENCAVLKVWLSTSFDVVKSFRLVVLGPLQEEMLFRAVVFHLIVNRLPKYTILSAVLTAFLFGISHAVNYSDDTGAYHESYVLLQIVMAFVIGLFYTMTLLNTGESQMFSCQTSQSQTSQTHFYFVIVRSSFG